MIESDIDTLREVLNIIDKLTLLELPESIDLFPTNLYGWLKDKDDGTKLSIHEVLSQAVIQGASDWFVHILDNNECKDKTEESRLQHLIRVIQLVRSDLQRAVEYYDRVFAELGQDLSEIKSNYANFHSWFIGGVSLWLEMAAFECFMLIEKAVELDNLLPLVLNVKYSSSSVDTLTIFYQIYQTFWKQLAWPDDEGSFSFVTKIIDIIYSLKKLLIDCTELLQQDCSSMGRVMRYLETNFDTVHQHLSSENFSRTLDLFWVQLGEDLYNLIQVNIQKWPPCWFKNLRECLKVMEQSLCGDDKEIDSRHRQKQNRLETLKCVEYLLEIYGMETADLIYQYHLERWQEQQAITEPKMGMLTVRAQFIENHLKIEIMNASQLAPVNTNSMGNTFVRIRLLPHETFGDVEKVKTKIYYNSWYPLYDETFVIPLTEEQSRLEDGLVHLVVKDKDMFSVSNTFVGEAYLHFTEVPHTPAPISSQPQQRLKLSRPTSFDDDKIKVLEFRQDDKQAQNFIQKEKQKMLNNKSFRSLAVPVLAIPTPFVRFSPSKVLGSLTQFTKRKSKPGKSSVPVASSLGDIPLQPSMTCEG